MMKKLGAIALVGLISTTFVACSDEANENIKGHEAPIINTDRQSIDFAEVALNQTASEEFRLTNVGKGPLVITALTLIEDSDTDAAGVELQRDDWPSSVTLDPEEFIDLTLHYSPRDESPDFGKVIVESNDPQNDGKLVIPVNTSEVAPRIFSNTNIVFQRVPPVTAETRDKAWRVSEVQNIGQAPLAISDIVISPADSDFTIKYPATVDAEAAADGDSAPASLESDESFPFRIYFNPQDNLPSTADLIFFTNDPTNPQYTVKLNGNSGSPCIKMSQEDEINFGEGGIGYANNKTITIENCSPTSDLEVSEIAVTDDGGGVYEVKEGSLPSPLPMDPVIIPADNTANFVLTYTPTDESVSNGQLDVRSNDPAKAHIEVPIVGKGTNNVCPQAVAEATLDGANRYQQQINTIPLKTIKFRATNSVDQNGTIASYEWAVISKPANSTARLEPTNTVPEPSLFLDLAGIYVIELTAYDNEGMASCNDDETRQITIRATPDEDIHVQLVWDTPADANQTDSTGADVDLHYMHPNGEWNKSPWDVHWLNPQPSWNDGSSPGLDIDDTDGSGPENVNHNDPADGLTYAVGVYYYSDFGYGPSYATIRIYIQGILTYEYNDQYLAGKGMFWYAATISWPSKAIFAPNTLTPEDFGGSF